MICKACGRECRAVGGVSTEDVSDCCGCEVVEEKTMETEWKTLELKNLPTDFFDNENYECRNYVKDVFTELTFDSKVNIITNLKANPELGVMYRSKPLETLVISAKMNEFMFNNQITGATFHKKTMLSCGGHDVVVV